MFFDFARGISAQAVVLGHALNIFLPGIFMVPGHRVFYMQSFAVIIFFVLSGYLITSAVLKKRDRPDFTFNSYLLDRVARVVYPLFPALALIIACDFLVFRGTTRLPFDGVDLSPQAVAGAFTMLFNHPILQELAPRLGTPWINAGPVGSGAPLWSVVAEWWIYVAFGVLAFVAFRKMKPGVGNALLLVFAIAVPVGYMAKGSYESLAWIIGMLYALAAGRVAKLPRSFHAWLVILGTAAFLVGLYYNRVNLHSASTIIPASVAFCHLYFLVDGIAAERSADGLSRSTFKDRSGRAFRAFSLFLSSYSYSLYLLHFSVVSYLWYFLHGTLPAWQLIALSILASNVVAFGFYLLVEKHFHRVGAWLKKVLLRPPAPVGGATTAAARNQDLEDAKH
ncbi:Peptidoglycan/LPS O-acetylase OafA/YrhL, contains acyltransferase and SGNH-hydrolase domains [Arthrobacter cupressi]|uniref:Peptidoglycan/LPS O-acetylase OafA/YrhL, contains acyltransferase and SGNH-hydrolase domains n=1 Tax=Arthrobacter cupressi TaxID=1045773 RepID=A0A1G8NYP6_9MICC|nr:Peptidoglycan/LPS O-acetylase OafA/YrhL, contains acyltransferase and SGNH-hydrolase domains [Arthrobacter cupressi]